MQLQWPLILFTFFIALSCGILFMQGLLTYKGKAKELQMTSLVASTVSLVVGGIAVFLHLQHWERVFNGFGHITSGITQELIGCVLMAIAIILFFLMMRRSEEGQAPKWAAVMAMVVPVVMIVVMAHSYNMESMPAWNTPMLEVFYLVNMLFMGALAELVLAAWKKADDAYGLCAKVALIGGLLQLAAVIVYAIVLVASSGSFANHGYYFDPTIPDVAMKDPSAVMMSVFTGDLAVPFWLGSVAIGGIVPVVLMYLARKKEESRTVLAYAGAALVCAMAGGLCWRGILYVAAISMFAIF